MKKTQLSVLNEKYLCYIGRPKKNDNKLKKRHFKNEKVKTRNN